jgi:acyl carrier protein
MLEVIIELILNYVEPEEEITEDSLLNDDLGLSSFDIACLGSDIEEAFGTELSAEDFRDLETVGRLVAFLREKQN